MCHILLKAYSWETRLSVRTISKLQVNLSSRGTAGSKYSVRVDGCTGLAVTGKAGLGIVGV
jgi:hypothetical protein